MYDKIGIIGNKDSVLIFKALGVDVFHALNAETAMEHIKAMDRKHYAVIFITEDLFAGLKEFLTRYKNRTYPAIVAVPTAKGATGQGLISLKQDMEKAIGFDILSK